MRRVLIIGCGGSGKSMLAGRIGELTGLPVIHLDSLYWKEDWVETPREEWRRIVQSLILQEAWVMDGNYGGTLDMRITAADTIIFLDLPPAVCLWRVLKRRISFHGRARPDMNQGCPERLNWEFIRWIWNYRRDRKPGVLQRLDNVGARKEIIVLKSQADVRSFENELYGRAT